MIKIYYHQFSMILNLISLLSQVVNRTVITPSQKRDVMNGVGQKGRMLETSTPRDDGMLLHA